MFSPIDFTNFWTIFSQFEQSEFEMVETIGWWKVLKRSTWTNLTIPKSINLITFLSDCKFGYLFHCINTFQICSQYYEKILVFVSRDLILLWRFMQENVASCCDTEHNIIKSILMENLINIWQMSNVATDEITVKSYILHKFVFKWICSKCLEW